MKNRTGKGMLISVVIVVVFAALSLMTGTRRVSAATFTVTNTGDNGGVNPAVGAGTGTLRQAIVDANAAAGADVIDFQAGLTGTITLMNGLPSITDNLMISGPGAGVLTVSGNSLYPVFVITPGVTASISGLTISNGSAETGGGIRNAGGMVTVTNSTLSGNSCMAGGGGAISNGGTFAVIDSIISGNSSEKGVGGGIFTNGSLLTVTNCTISGNSTNTNGGGVFSGGPTTITGSTVSGNSAIVGGGIFNNVFGSLTVTNSTISGNSAQIAGGIHNIAGSVAVTSSTISVNSAAQGGGIFNEVNGTITIKNSIVANSSSGGDCSISAPFNASGANFATDGSCPNFTQVTSAQLNLGPLQVNSPGATATHALLFGSVAIDAVTDCTDIDGNPVTRDQRGVTRPQGPACDAGAFEREFCAVTCPANISVSNAPNQCGAVVNYPDPTTSGDGCGKIICSPPSGSTFPLGTTTVTCTAQSGQSCTFTVTVNDTQLPSITCPANVVNSTDPNLCSAVVNYAAPTVSDNCPGVGVPMCVPASGSTFPKGTTTVTCAVADASGNTASCSFTVTVNDTQPPTITCPANVTAVVAQTCPISSSATVNFPAPAISDNCPGVTSACNPPSGSVFPVGTTTVTCTATDTSGNTATCSFTVTVFSGCLQDDSNPANVVLFNAATGEYRFCCGGTTFSGVGTVLVKGCTVSIQHNPADRRVLIKFDGAVGAGTASLQSPPGTIRCTIADRNTRNNTCACVSNNPS